MDDWKSSLILSDLQAACNALGGWEDATYVKEADCVESLKDLLRAIRRDDESFAVRRALGKINVVRTDLIPLIRFYHNDEEIFDIGTKLLVNLTTPVILLYKEELPIEKTARNIYISLESTNCTYKDAFLEKEIWSVLGERLEKLMNINYTERNGEDKEVMERILVLIRNVLHPIHKEELTLKTDGDVSSHDRLLWALHLAGIDDLIIFLCASRMEQSYTLHVLEILRLMLREQEAEYLASTGEQRSKEEVQKEVDDLQRERQIEQRRKQIHMKAALQNRFARFSSTYQVKNVKSLNDTRDLVIIGDEAKVLQSLNNVDLDKKKKFRARAKNRRPESCASIKRRTTLNIRLFLKEFCFELMSSAFNSLLPQARRAIGRTGDAGDEGHYFWLLDFFLAFNRMTGFDISLVSEAISRETFHFVQTQMEKCHEMMVTDKRRIHLWVKRLHLYLKTFKQLLTTVSAMGHHADPQVCEASKHLQRHLFHLPEYRDIALHMLLNFNESVAPVEFLRDLAHTVHIYLRMLERCSSQQKTKADGGKAKPQRPKIPEFTDMTEEELDNKWLDLSREITDCLSNETTQFDFDINELLEGFHQYEEGLHIQICKHKLTDFLRIDDLASAMGLLQACQRHFPQEECFGEISMSPEDQLMLLKKFLYAESMGSLDDMPEISEDQEFAMGNFDFEEFLKRFVNPKVIKAYSLLLSHFRENTPEMNKVCLKMLHRIAFDLRMSAMLFDAQVFVTFDKILEDFSIMPEKADLKELSRFAKFIIQQFTETLKINDLALVELLFWKTSSEAYQIQYGYNDNVKSKTTPWTEEEEHELKNLYEQHRESVAPGQDVIEVVQKEFSNQTRTRRQIINQLRNLGVIEKGTRFKSAKSGITSSRQPWSLEEEQELQELYQRFMGSLDPLTQIMLNQTRKRPKFRIIEKLLELGCIQDRSEVRKRRVRKNGGLSAPRRSASKKESDPSCISKEFLSTSDDSSSDDDNHDRRRERGHTVLEGEAENLEGASSSSRLPKRKKKNVRQKKPRRRVVEKVKTSEELHQLLQAAVHERRSAIDWIMESLQDALEDWRDSNNEAVPLVPLAAADHESLEDEDFCKLLATFGLLPPQEEIEQYWRIPGNLSKSMLSSRLDVLRAATEGTFNEGTIVEERREISGNEGQNSTLSSEGRESDTDNEEEHSPTESSDHSADGSPVSEAAPQTSQRVGSPLSSSGSSQPEASQDEEAEEAGPGNSNEDTISSTGATKRSSMSPPQRVTKKRKFVIESDESAPDESL